MNRIAALAALVVGVVLIVTPLALSLFERAYAGQRIADGFGQVMSPEGVVQQQQGLDLVGEMIAGFNKSSPVFARELGMSRPAYDRFVAENYPAVAITLEQIPPAATTIVAPVVTEAQKIQGKWENVIHIPGLGLPIAGAPWIMLLGGVALVLVGLIGVARPDRRVTAAILALAVALGVAPFALSLPSKVSDTGDVLKLGRIAVSQRTATAAHGAALIVDDMVRQIEVNMLPDLARRLDVPRADLERRIAQDYPGLATALTEWPGLAPAAFNLTAAQQASVEDFKEVDEIGYTGLPWVAIGPGIALLLLAGGALLFGTRRRRY